MRPNLLPLSLLLTLTSSEPENRFLKQILLGRCYEKPPTGDLPDECMSIVSNLIAVFEGNRDEDITTSNYEPYLSSANFKSPHDKGLLIIPDDRVESTEEYGDFVTVKDTPGGSLLKDLVFCGNNVKGDCPFGTYDRAAKQWKGAQASFWAGANAKFASGVSGRVRAVVAEGPEPNEPLYQSLLESAVIPSLEPTLITEFDIYLVPKEKGPGPEVKRERKSSCDGDIVLFISNALKKRGVTKVTCTEDPYLMRLFCSQTEESDNPRCRFAEGGTEKVPTKEVPSEEVPTKQDVVVEPEEPPKKRHPIRTFFVIVFRLFMFAIIAVGALKLYQRWSGNEYDFSSVRGGYENLPFTGSGQ